MDEKIAVKALEQYLDRYIKDHYKKHQVYGKRFTNQFMKVIIQSRK